jgi:thiamine-monophosphate kinase
MYLIGGDISASWKSITVSATVLGYAKKYIKRSGARIGDKIYATGNLGDSACGLEILKRLSDGSRKMVNKIILRDGEGEKRGNGEKEKEKKKSPGLRLSDSPGLLLEWNDVEPLLRRHLMPVARNPKNFASYATSMIDISDGLLIDLSRLCDESKVGARIYKTKIPKSAELKKVASSLSISPLKLALSGGEDYELLFTASAGKKIKAKCIGEIVKSQRVIIDISGKEKPFSAEGYKHFVP